MEMVRHAVEEEQADVSHENSRGVFPLYLAAREGRTRILRYLVETARARVNQRTREDGRTALLGACESGQLCAVEYLLTHAKADLRQTTVDGVSALYLACQKGHVAVCQFLVERAGADVRCRSKDSEFFPLYGAAGGGHAELVRYLVESCGADVGQVTADGASALFIACFKGHLQCARVLVECAHADVHQSTTDGFFPLYIASCIGHLHVVTSVASFSTFFSCLCFLL